MRILNGFYIFAICFVIIAGILIGSKKNKQKADYFLLLFLFTSTLILGAFYLYFEYAIAESVLLLLYRNQLQMPILFFYVISVLRPKKRFLKRYLFLFTPLFISTLHMSWCYYFLSEAEFISLFSTDVIAAPGLYLLTIIADLAMEPVMVIIMLRLLYKYRLALRDNYSYLQGIEFRWIRRLLWIDVFAWFAIGVTSYMLNLFFPEYEMLLFQIGGGLICVIVIYICFFGLRQTHIFAPQFSLPVEEKQPQVETERGENGDSAVEKYAKSTLTESMAGEIQESLEKHVQVDTLYLNPKLGLAEVAAITGYPAHTISEVLNSYMNTNFYDFINDMRVEEAKRKLVSGMLKTQTVLAIALESGFNSKSSFNRLFKLKTGMTPSQFVFSQKK